MIDDNNTKQTIFEALPIEVANSTMTSCQLKVLEILFLYNGLDKAKDKGLFFISNETIMQEAGIGSKTTLNKVIRFFDSNGFIERKSGNFSTRQASEYILHEDKVIEWSIDHPKGNTGKPNRTPSNDKIYKELKKIIESATKPLLEKQNELVCKVKALQDEIAALRASVCTPSEINCTTECTTDTDTKTDEIIIKESTDSTVTQPEGEETVAKKQTVLINEYDDKITELKQTVERFKEYPTPANKKNITVVIEAIKSIHKRGGCTKSQLNRAYAIQAQINKIPFTNGSSPHEVKTVPNTISINGDVNISTPNINACYNTNKCHNPFQPTEEEHKGIMELITSSKWYSQDICDALIAKLRPYAIDIRKQYIDMYLSHTNNKDMQYVYQCIVYPKLEISSAI